MADKREKRTSNLNTTSRLEWQTKPPRLSLSEITSFRLETPLTVNSTMDLIKYSLHSFIKCKLSSISFPQFTRRFITVINPENRDKPEFQYYSKL